MWWCCKEGTPRAPPGTPQRSPPDPYCLLPMSFPWQRAATAVAADGGPRPSTHLCVCQLRVAVPRSPSRPQPSLPVPGSALRPPLPRGAHRCPRTGPGPSPVLGLVNFLATALAGMEAEGRQLLWGPLIIPLRQAALITSGKKFIRAAALTTFICAAGSDSLGSQIKAMMGPDEIHCLFILCDLIHLPIHHPARGIPPGPAPAPPFPSQPSPAMAGRGAPAHSTAWTQPQPGAPARPLACPAL